MKTRDISLSLFLLVFTAPLFAQETATPATPQPTPPGAVDPMNPMATPAMPPMNPTQLLRMRNQLTFELQEIQRIVGLVNPGDAQLLDMHKQRQKEVVDQLKDIETQLKAQGVPTVDPMEAAAGVPANVPPAQDPTLVPGGLPRLPADPNLLVQRLPDMSRTPQMPPGFQMMNPQMPPQQIPGVDPMMPVPTTPTGFDQDQAWNNSPWVPQPSKELADMKQTVESLRQEIGELKATVKALETQIQLLNRNILLSQPQAPANP